MLPRLKSLELHGYKTFASRTQFQFPGIITAIVGPNGSGKSNIADSLRWVLGEQSYALLRGRKTEDMIFSGSEHRPRAGMASATITFDNSDGWLPIDFSEVSITRRAYRDGQNEYLLNGQKVRLREISELLAQSGLAERTYTIIGQGLVDAALALKPEERRRLFEEAAGIGLYRTRREEAITRLESTKRNLDRVQDILAELEPRLGSLERQAKKTQEYERVKADLRLLLRDWYGYHWHRVQQDMTHAKDVLKAQETRLEQARQHQEEVSAQLAVLRARVNELRVKLNAWHVESAQYHREREQQNRTLAILDERQRSLIDQRQNWKNDLVRLEEELTAAQNRLEAAQAERQRLQSESEEAQKQVQIARQALQAREQERSRVDKVLREIRQRLVSSETRQVQLKAHQNELSSRLENQRNSLDGIDKAIAAAQAEQAKAQARFDQIAEERQQAESGRQSAQAELQAFRQQMQDLEARRRKLADERAQIENERARVRVQLDVLDQAERSFSGLGNGARFLLQSSKQGKLKGRYQSFQQLMEVPAGYEAAIAAALGELIDLVLLQDSEPEEALRLLEQGAHGRAALLPQQWLQPRSPLAIQVNDQCLGLASELIQAPAENRRVLDALLGHVVIVCDRATARQVVGSLPASARVVTLQGEVFYPDGAVVVGKENGASDGSAALSRTRQKRELEARLGEFDQQIADAKAAVEGAEREIGAARQREGELDAALREANRKLEKINEQHQQAQVNREQARRQVDWQTNQRKNLEGQIKRTEDERSQGQADLERLDGELTRLRTELREANGLLAGLPLEDLQAQVAHWNTSQAVASRAMKDAEQRVNEVQQVLQRNRQQHHNLEQRLTEMDTQLANLDREKESARVAESRVAELIEALRVQIEPTEKDLGEAEKAYEDMQAIDDNAQQALTVAERYYTQATLEVGHKRENLESVRRRIEEDFGLVAFEYEHEVSGQTPLPFEGMVEQLPVLTELAPELEDNISRIRGQIRRMGAINPDALTEYNSVKERFQFLTTQVADLKKADQDLRQVIAELDELMKREFRRTFDAVSVEFKHMFSRLFGGGTARLVLSDADHPTEAGIDIEARLPGRREQGLSLLSGGERSLTAVALVFSLLKVSPTPFCVMDEVDAMLDEANVGRFRDMLRELSKTTQFIVITHNRNTVQAADVIYGITMGRDSASQMMSLRIEEVPEEMAK